MKRLLMASVATLFFAGTALGADKKVERVWKEYQAAKDDLKPGDLEGLIGLIREFAGK